jgi:ADP-heptose:LPS heptosyltransferase
MIIDNRNLYLPFRALGDFVISAAIVKNYGISKVPIVLPNYLTDLFFEINADNYFEVVAEINFPHYPKLFEIHKIKTWADIKGFIGDQKIVASLPKGNNYIVDANCKRLFLTGQKFIHPMMDGNVYATRHKLLSELYNLKPLQSVDSEAGLIKKIIIFPGSRKLSKEIDFTVVKDICTHFSNQKVVIDMAYHVTEAPGVTDDLLPKLFKNFNELKNIIQDYDFIISADSLPVHMAYYLNKPHYCLYNKVSNENWLTPFGVKNHFFSVITENQNSYGDNIFNKIEAKGYIFEQTLISK